MTNKTRGSDQLKLNCTAFSALTQEEVMQVAGGASSFLSIQIRGTPAVWLSTGALAGKLPVSTANVASF